MRISYASEPAPGSPLCEDYVVCGPDWVVVLDGATPAAGVESGCSHGVAWLVRRLAGALAPRLAAGPGRGLADLLAESIMQTRQAHGDGCDLANPDSPSTTVALLRLAGGRVEWLVLADSPVVLDTLDGVVPILDGRIEGLPERTVGAVRAARNSPGGFWVASTVPEAAHHAVTGSMPVEMVSRVGVFTDGGSRLVERFGTTDWKGLLDLAGTGGPHEVIRRTRAAEARETGTRPGKRHDDATVVLALV